MKINLNKLNGWQRLWVLATVLWLIVVAFFSITSAPRKFERAPLPPDSSLEEQYSRQQTDVALSKPPTSLNAEGKLFLAKAIRERAEIKKMYVHDLCAHIFFSLLFWIIPVVFIYLFGFSIGWVLQGFKKSHKGAFNVRV